MSILVCQRASCICWCRRFQQTQQISPYRVNMGTADEVALDILINALSVFSRE